MKASTVPSTCKLSLLQIAARILAMPYMFQGYMETEIDRASGSGVSIELQISVCCAWVSICKCCRKLVVYARCAPFLIVNMHRALDGLNTVP